MIDEQDQQDKSVNQNTDEVQSNMIRDEMALLALSANDRCAMMAGYGPPPGPIPGRVDSLMNNRMGAPLCDGMPVRWNQELRPVESSEPQVLPQDSERMGLIYGPAPVMNDVNRVAMLDQNEDTLSRTVDSERLFHLEDKK